MDKISEARRSRTLAEIRGVESGGALARHHSSCKMERLQPASSSQVCTASHIQVLL